MSFPQPPSPYTTGSDAGGARSAPDVAGQLYGTQLAAWPRRTAATVIDVVVTIYLPNLIPSVGVATVLIILLVALNSVFLQARTSQSLGKVLLGVSLIWPVWSSDTQASAACPSFARCILRVVAHLLDSIFIVGFLRPIWNPRRQTFADSIAKTVVMVGRPGHLVHASMSARSTL